VSVVLVLLVLAWAIVLLPAWLRSRAERGSGDSIVDFRRRLSVLHSSQGGPGPRRTSLYPESASVLRARARRAQKRRRDIFMGLLASMVGSLALGFLPGMRVLWLLHLALDAVFLMYVLLLLRLRHSLPRVVPAYYAEEAPQQELAFAYTRRSN
jgi:hypothetical protein